MTRPLAYLQYFVVYSRQPQKDISLKRLYYFQYYPLHSSLLLSPSYMYMHYIIHTTISINFGWNDHLVSNIHFNTTSGTTSKTLRWLQLMWKERKEKEEYEKAWTGGISNMVGTMYNMYMW